jgi:hypothetical protein
MRRLFLTYIFWNFISFLLYSQTFPIEMGARSGGLGNANSNMTDEWSIFNNVGGISGVENGAVFFGYKRYFEIEGFDKIAAGVIQPSKIGNFGISVCKSGDELYNEQIASAAFGNKIGFVRLGFRANYYQISVGDFGTIGSFFFDFGGIVELAPKLSFAAYISNFTLSKLDDSENTVLPVFMKTGFSYKPSKSLRINLDLFKDVDYDPNIKAGIEYIIVKKFYLRTGVNFNPYKSFFGAGIHLKRFRIDYAINTDQFLGNSHQASISFNYQNKDDD